MTTDAPWGSRERPWPISASDLDNWSYFCGPGQNPLHESVEPMTDADFQARLNRVMEAPSVALILGKCFHAAIEGAMIRVRDTQEGLQVNRLIGEADGYKVEFACADLDVDLSSYSVIEQDLELTFDTPSGWVVLRGVKDGLRGTVIRDLKTTKSFKAEKFQDAWQWRAYLQAAGPRYQRFDYLVFVLGYGKPQEKALAAGQTAQVEVREFHKLTVWRYPGMLRDLQGIAGELAAYLRQIQWEPPPKREMAIF